jgi:hypothetical protein
MLPAENIKLLSADEYGQMLDKILNEEGVRDLTKPSPYTVIQQLFQKDDEVLNSEAMKRVFLIAVEMKKSEIQESEPNIYVLFYYIAKEEIDFKSRNIHSVSEKIAHNFAYGIALSLYTSYMNNSHFDKDSDFNFNTMKLHIKEEISPDSEFTQLSRICECFNPNETELPEINQQTQQLTLTILQRNTSEFICLSDVNDAILTEREEEIRKLCNKIAEVRELFVKLAAMVHHQSELIQGVNRNCEEALEITKEGYINIVAAHQYQKSGILTGLLTEFDVALGNTKKYTSNTREKTYAVSRTSKYRLFMENASNDEKNEPFKKIWDIQTQVGDSLRNKVLKVMEQYRSRTGYFFSDKKMQTEAIIHALNNLSENYHNDHREIRNILYQNIPKRTDTKPKAVDKYSSFYVRIAFMIDEIDKNVMITQKMNPLK